MRVVGMSHVQQVVTAHGNIGHDRYGAHVHPSKPRPLADPPPVSATNLENCVNYSFAKQAMRDCAECQRLEHLLEEAALQ